MLLALHSTIKSVKENTLTHSLSLSLISSGYQSIILQLFLEKTLQKGSIFALLFDDALFDFYHFVFPLLQKYQLKAVSSSSHCFYL